jgi:hypothetical protein
MSMFLKVMFSAVPGYRSKMIPRVLSMPSMTMVGLDAIYNNAVVLKLTVPARAADAGAVRPVRGKESGEVLVVEVLDSRRGGVRVGRAGTLVLVVVVLSDEDTGRDIDELDV